MRPCDGQLHSLVSAKLFFALRVHDVLYVKFPLNSVNHTAEEYSVCTGVAYRCGMSHTDDAQCSCWAMLQFSLSEQMSSLWVATGHCPDR